MLPAAVKNKIEQIWLDVIAGGVSQPTEVIEQLTYLMFAKQIDEREADIETAELLSGQKQTHIFGESKEEQALHWRNFKGMEARELYKHFVEHVFTMYGLMLSAMAGGKNFGKLKRHVVSNANTLLSECATIPELKELTNDNYWNAKDILKFEETRKSLRDIMKFIPPKKVKIHYTDFEDEVVFREEGRKVDMGSSDFEDYRAKVNEYVEAHKNQPAINKLLHNEPITADDYKELERIFTEELGTAEDYQTNYQDTPFGLMIRKIAKMDRDAAYAAFSTFIAEERPNAEQIHFIEQVVDYVVENGYINNVLDLMKAPFDRPYKFSVIFTREEQIKFVQVINSIKSNALVA